MKRVPAIALAVAACTTLASAQHATSLMGTRTAPPVTSLSKTGGFLIGTDDCNAAHRAISGAGPHNFATGVTGTTGQTEALCYFFGSTTVDNDVWFDWTNDNTADTGSLTTCTFTTVDTKIAIYPQSVCPTAGSALACNDDACPGFQTTVKWNKTPNTVYTIQLGTFPGATGGTGSFTINKVTLPHQKCGTKDDGTTENGWALTNGGEFGWIKIMNCMTKYDQVETAWGTLQFPGTVANGTPARLATYTHPNTGPVPPAPGDLGWVLNPNTVNTTVVNGNTDILTAFPVPHKTRVANSWTMIIGTNTHAAGFFPGPADQDQPNNNAWMVGGTPNLNLAALGAAAPLPPTNMNSAIPCTWLLRLIDTTDTTLNPGTGVPTCFGDGTGTLCPCGNGSGPGEGGCRTNFPGGGCGAATQTGTLLTASGSTSLGAQADPTTRLVLTANNTTTQPGLFFSGSNTIGGGAGVVFGDGLRCCGQNVIRHQLTDLPPPVGGGNCPANGSTTVNVTSTGTPPTAGQKKCYQYWYRNPGARSICGTNFNLSNAISITWQP
jgi:hypothetical protein